MFPVQTCTGLGVGMFSCASEPMFLGTANAEKGETLRRRARNSAGCGKGQNQGHPGPHKMAVFRGERQGNGCI